MSKNSNWESSSSAILTPVVTVKILTCPNQLKFLVGTSPLVIYGAARWWQSNSKMCSQNDQFGLVYHILYQFFGMDAKKYNFRMIHQQCQEQNNWGNWGSPGVMKLWVAWEVLRWLMKFRELCSGGFHPNLVTPPYHGFLNVNTPPNSQNSKRH